MKRRSINNLGRLSSRGKSARLPLKRVFGGRKARAGIRRKGKTDGRRRVVVVDAHPIVRFGLVELFHQQADIVVVGETGDTAEALELVRSRKPHLVIVELTLHPKNGLELIKDIRALKMDCALLIFTTHDESLYAARLLQAGARGYLMKDVPATTILEAVRRVLSGDFFLSDQMKDRLLIRATESKSDLSLSPVDRLTDRELEVFQLLGGGFSNREMAARLNLSVKTIESHRENLKHKLGVRSGPRLVRTAIRWAKHADTIL